MNADGRASGGAPDIKRGFSTNRRNVSRGRYEDGLSDQMEGESAEARNIPVGPAGHQGYDLSDNERRPHAANLAEGFKDSNDAFCRSRNHGEDISRGPSSYY